MVDTSLTNLYIEALGLVKDECLARWKRAVLHSLKSDMFADSMMSSLGRMMLEAVAGA